MMKRALPLINKVWFIFLIGLMIYELIVHGSTNTLAKNLILLSIIPISFGPFLIEKLLHYKMSDTLTFSYYLFICVALVFGSILRFYQTIEWFDLFAHFLSGIVFSLVALIILKSNNLLKKENVIFVIIFMSCFNLAIASFWEFFEFFSDKLLGGDTQWVKSTGVDDTMTDMLIAFLGVIFSNIYYFIKMKQDSNKFLKLLNKVL